MRRWSAYAVILSAALLLAWPAQANLVCSERDELISQLKQKFGEQPAAMGLLPNGAMLEVLAAEAGSWTMLMTDPDGTSCVLHVGEAWEQLDPQQYALAPRS